MRIRIPAPALFLATGLIAAAASNEVAGFLTFEDLSRLGSVALAIILFNGGFAGGWKRTRQAIVPIMNLGIVGTFATTALLAGAGHYAIGLEWEIAALLAIALAPTDPAAVFSVLRGHALRGRSDVVLEGESGANDPVGIALMIGAIEYVARNGTVTEVALEFLLALGVGLFVGVVLGAALCRIVSWVDFRNPYAQTVVMIAGALTAYATADLFSGSGFLAAFVAGLLMGDVSTRSNERSHYTLGISATGAEMVLFFAMGTSVDTGNLTEMLGVGLASFAILTFAIRPAVVFALLTRSPETMRERAFISWGGLKGAVPLLLASFPIVDGIDGSADLYTAAFVAVLTSIVIQGMTMPAFARWCGIADEATS
jgi:cell volume regulation protein A